jgi:phosphoribosylanthranilate isomerase
VLQFKICGLCRPQDAVLAVNAGATHLGLIMVPNTPRYVDEKLALTMMQASQVSAPWVGVTQNQSPQQLHTLAKQLPLRLLQLHGNETPDQCDQVSQATALPVIKALAVQSPSHSKALLASAMAYQSSCYRVLLDRPKGYAHPDQWLPELLTSLQALGGLPLPFWVAGGLTPTNIGHVLSVLTKLDGFCGVDIASGVEVDGQPRQKSVQILAQLTKAFNTNDKYDTHRFL